LAIQYDSILLDTDVAGLCLRDDYDVKRPDKSLVVNTKMDLLVSKNETNTSIFYAISSIFLSVNGQYCPT